MKRMIGMVALVGLCLSNLPAAAAETAEDKVGAQPVATISQAGSLARIHRDVKRPAVLPALYVSFGAVQAWDVYTTSAALKNGAREANPVAAPFAGSSAQMFALKAASTAGTVYFVERLWKQNKVAAVVVMAAINGATAAIAMNNARNAQQGRGRGVAGQ